ncbi:MAG: CatA-like O-acetyltransferase [Rhizobiaceae bacterium]
MAARQVDLVHWQRADQFRFFRRYERPHYAVTSRLDVSRMRGAGKVAIASPYRACIHAIGAGIHGVPELLMRFRDDTVFIHDRVDLSMTVALDNGNFNYAHVPWSADFSAFDAQCAALIAAAKAGGDLKGNTGQRDDLAYLSCMPWLDYTSINNAMPGPDDCIPRVTWGRFTDDGNGRHSMAMTIEVHHALVDGRQVGDYFALVQAALSAF